MKQFCALLALVFLTVPACAADSSQTIDSIAGVYKDRFDNAFVTGEEYTAENILEIVKVSPTSAYIRTHLEFYNGHLCDFWGVADLQGDVLAYNNTDVNEQGQQCRLRLRITDDALTFDDIDGVCREFSCGARGSYSDITFERKARRDIGYMKLILGSSEYAEALKEYEEIGNLLYESGKKPPEELDLEAE